MGKGGAGAIGNSSVNWDRVALEEYKEDLERRKKKTPEEKRFEEIKGGIITTCVGLGLMIFFNLLFDAIANSVGRPEANILRSLWAIGLVPFLVGLGVTFNGLIVSKRLIELKKQQSLDFRQPSFSEVPITAPVTRLGEASQSSISDYSITESTTTKLREPIPSQSSRDTN